MDKPFSLIALSIIFGIILSNSFIISTNIVIVFVFLLILICLYRIIKDKPNQLLILLLFLLLGVLFTNINKSSELVKYASSRSNLIGIVDELVELNEDHSKYIVIIRKVDNEDVDEKIILKIKGKTKLIAGDMVSINGVLRIPARNTNPKLFNYRINLLSDKIHTTMTIEDYSIQVLGNENTFGYSLKSNFTKDISEVFKTYLSEDNALLITSIILGKSSYLEEEDLTKYRQLGLAHILAVSGLHIGIITGFIIYVFSRIGIKRKLNVIFSLTIIWIYVYLIGFPPSAVRASIMFSVLFYSQLIHEPYDSINTIMFSIILSLIINPFWLFNVGFQLSYMATISLLLFSPKIINLFYPLKGKIVVTISTIIGVNIGLLPFQAYYFNSVPLLGLISNIITVPLLSLALIMGVIMIVLNYTFSFLNYFLGYILDLILSLQYLIVNLLYKIPINSIITYSPDLFEILLFYVALGIIFNFIKLKEYSPILKKIIFYYLLVLISLTTLDVVLDDSIELEFIDVGQGDSILIKTQGSTYLMDTGGSFMGTFDIGKNITLPYLLKEGISTLDGVIITHFDEDHSQGLDALIEGIKIKAIYSSYDPEFELMKKINFKNIPLIHLDSSKKLILDRNTSMEMIWPNNTIDINNFSSNNKSLVSVLSYKDSKILFTGDIEKEVEHLIIEDLPEDIEILKVAHHGSKTSSTKEFIDKVKPKNSIIQVGLNNFYGHPNEDVEKRLENINSIIYRTDKMGLIKVIMDDKANISSYLESVEEINISTYIWRSLCLIIFYILYYLISYILIKNFIFKRSVIFSEFY